MQTASRKVGEFLVNRKVLSKDALEYALSKESETGVPSREDPFDRGARERA